MKTLANRRTLLKEIALGAGATVLGPILNSLAAHAAGEKQAVGKRVIFVMQSNGINPLHLVPQGMKRRSDGKNSLPQNDQTEEYSLRDKELHRALEPLTPFQDRITLLQGLSGRISRSDHSANFGALGACPAGKGPMLQTIDSAVAGALPGIFPHVALGYGGNDDAMCYAYSASAPGKALPIICRPDLAFKSLFGSVDGSGRADFSRQTDLLEFMADDVRRARQVLVGDEREKFDRYLESFEALHQRQQKILTQREALTKHAPRLGEKLTTSTSSLILEAQFETAGAALVAGLTNVVTLVSGGGGQRFGKFPEFGIPDLHHIGHGGSYGEKTSEECFVELRRFHLRLLAGLAQKLASIPEGDGTMLDHSLIVYLSDSGESHHPNLQEWPVVLLGDLGGKLKPGGRYLQLPQYKAKAHRTMANLYCTLLHATGRPTDTFGVPDPELRDINQKGVVSELLA